MFIYALLAIAISCKDVCALGHSGTDVMLAAYSHFDLFLLLFFGI